jgi:N-formylglutamate amidohydrolase
VQAALRRIATLHRPYHAKLAELLDSAQRRFGFALLLDCHSMPSSSPDVGNCDIVLGDRYGSSAARWMVDVVEQSLRASGLNVRRNKPYAGGYITEHFGAPAAGRHALQIEINRSLYMDERALKLHEGAASLTRALSDMVAAICAKAREAQGTRWAAE